MIDEIFAAVLELLIEEGYLKLEHFFVDGAKLEANANRHQVVWAKSHQKYAERLQQKVQEILAESSGSMPPKMKPMGMTTRMRRGAKMRSIMSSTPRFIESSRNTTSRS